MARTLKTGFHQAKQPDERDGGVTRTLSRGLALLSEILDADTPPTLTELALQTGLSKATVSRLLATLVEAGFAAQTPGGQTYSAGPSIARWLRTSPLEALLTQQATPVLSQLRDLSGETSVLCVPVWPDRVCIARSLSESPIRAQKTIGENGPLTRGCSGRAFLAFATERYVDAALQARPLVRMTDTSIVDVDRFLARLRTERELGYTMSTGGTYPDMNGIAVPIFAASSTLPIAVINVSGPSARWTKPAMERFAPTLKEHAAQLTAYFTSERLS